MEWSGGGVSDSEPEILKATVVRLDARGCLVRLDQSLADLPGDGRELFCGVRGKLHNKRRRHQRSPVVVGDRVDVVRTQEDRGGVVAVEARTSTLSRPGGRTRREHVLAANVDQVVVVSAAAEPDFVPGLVDRVLAVVEFSKLEAVVVVNKMDLAEEVPDEVAWYRFLGYTVIETSVPAELGIDTLREQLADRTSVVTGHSGVGKSSLLNAVQPELGIKVGDVNAVTRKGTHTTTAATWFPLEDGGAVVDTAGVREFGLYGIPPRDVGWLFRDIAKLAPECRFPDCSHRHEPDCMVIAAAEEAVLPAFRYESYLRIVESLEDDASR